MPGSARRRRSTPKMWQLLFSSEVDTKVSLQWSGDRLVESTERRLGGLALDVSERPARSRAGSRPFAGRPDPQARVPIP